MAEVRTVQAGSAQRAGLRESFARDGVVRVASAFDAAQMALVDAAFAWTLAHPGPGAATRYTDEPGTFFETTGHSVAAPPYVALLGSAPLQQLLHELFGGRPAWYLGEQLFLKQGDRVRRTPWHQDLSYLNFRGDSVLGIWISLGDLPKPACLEFVRGSHRGPLYNGASYIDARDDTHPLYPDTDMPRLPAIELDRSGWDILSWELTRGDLLVFHLGTLHGGGGTQPGVARRSLTLRFFSDDACWSEPLPAVDPNAFSARRNRAWAESGQRPVALAVTAHEPMHVCGRFQRIC